MLTAWALAEQIIASRQPLPTPPRVREADRVLADGRRPTRRALAARWSRRCCEQAAATTATAARPIDEPRADRSLGSFVLLLCDRRDIVVAP